MFTPPTFAQAIAPGAGRKSCVLSEYLGEGPTGSLRFFGDWFLTLAPCSLLW